MTPRSWSCQGGPSTDSERLWAVFGLLPVDHSCTLHIWTVFLLAKTCGLKSLFYLVVMKLELKMFFVLSAKLKSSLTDLFYFIFTKYYNKMTSLRCELLFLWTIYFSDVFQLRFTWSTVKPLLVPIWWCQSRYGSWTEMSHSANIVHVCSNSSYLEVLLEFRHYVSKLSLPIRFTCGHCLKFCINLKRSVASKC